MLSLRTKRCLISPLIVEDFEDILAMYQEPNSNTYIPPLLNKSQAEYLDFLTMKVNSNNQPKGLGFWTVRGLDNGTFIGTANLNVMGLLPITHIGCHLSNSIWGQGYGTEIMAALLDYGLNSLKLPVIHGICSTNHYVSKKMLMRVGLVFEKRVELRGEEIEIYHNKQA